jgi:hypothetical protein
MKKKIGSEAKEVAWWIQQVKELRACSEKTPGLEEAIEGFEAAIGRVTARYANEGRLSEIASAVRRMPKPTDLQLLVIKAWKNLVSRTWELPSHSELMLEIKDIAPSSNCVPDPRTVLDIIKRLNWPKLRKVGK